MTRPYRIAALPLMLTAAAAGQTFTVGALENRLLENQTINAVNANILGSLTVGSDGLLDVSNLFDVRGSLIMRTGGEIDGVRRFKTFGGSETSMSGQCRATVEEFRHEGLLEMGGVARLRISTGFENRSGSVLRLQDQARIERIGASGRDPFFRNDARVEALSGFIENFDVFQTSASGETIVGGGTRIGRIAVLEYRNLGVTRLDSNGTVRATRFENESGAELVVQPGGRVSLGQFAAGPFANRGSVLVTGGRVDNVTLADTFAGSTTTVQDGGVMSVFRYTNAGLTTIDSGGRIETGQTFIRPAGEVRVGPGGTLLGTNGMFVDDGATLALDGGTVDVVSNFLDFSGEMLVTGDAQVLSISAGGLVLTGGDASIASVGDATLEGTIFGQGSIFGTDAPITLEGSVAPGLASNLLTVGTIEWIGDVSLGSAAELVIDVLDLSSHDVIAHRTATATLGGTLKVALGADYTPTDGDAFDIVTSSGSLDGRFTDIEAPELSDNLFFTVDYTDSAAALRVVPAPAGAALLGVAGVLASSRRRRR